MMIRGVIGNNPGRIPMSVSPLRGEVLHGCSMGRDAIKEHCEEYIINYPSRFKEFSSPAWGYRAMFLLLRNSSEIYGLHTLRRIIQHWCRFSEIKSSEFARAVAKRLGRSVHSHIDTSDHDVMVSLVCSISKVENGISANLPDVEEGWQLFAAGV